MMLGGGVSHFYLRADVEGKPSAPVTDLDDGVPAGDGALVGMLATGGVCTRGSG
jgi:hypothetical protein